MRDLKTLYDILLNTYLETGYYLCIRIDILRNDLITGQEHILLKKHFLSQYPSEVLHPEFYHSKSFNRNLFDLRGSWFDSKQIRIDFLNKIISTL